MVEFDITRTPVNPFSIEGLHLPGDTSELRSPTLHITDNLIDVRVGNAAISLSLDDSISYMEPLVSGSWASEEESLAAVPAHQDAGAGLRRSKFQGAPYHSALHIVDDGERTNSNYCTIHQHDTDGRTDDLAYAELNVIVPSESGLSYDLYDGVNWRAVSEPTAVWLPPGLAHCAIARRGSGLFFVSRFAIAPHAYYNAVAPSAHLVDAQAIDPASAKSAFERQFGSPFFEYLEQQPLAWAFFNLKMEYSLRDLLPLAVFSKIPLPKTGTIADIGGGLGYALEQINRQRPDLTTILCEQPFVCQQAAAMRGTINEMQSVDIFTDKLPEADVYLLTRVLHDWPDEVAIRLLQNIKRAAPPHAELRIIDTFLAEDRSGPARALQQQQTMDLLFKTRQHTVSEVNQLLAAAGWESDNAPILLSENSAMSCLTARLAKN